MNSKIHLSKNSLNEYFQAISHYFRVYSLSGFLKGRSMNVLVFFFPALAEVQVVVLSVLNLIRQGFPATCRIGHCCVCSPLLYASEIICDSSTYSKQRMTEIIPSRCHAWKPKIHDDVRHAEWRLLEFVYGLLLGNCGYQTDRKNYL